MVDPRWAGFWGEFDRHVELEDELIVDPATFAGMIQPVCFLPFNGFTVPGGRILMIKSICVGSPWHLPVLTNCTWRLSRTRELKRSPEYSVTDTPKVNGTFALGLAPETVSGHWFVYPGQRLCLSIAGVPFAEPVGGNGGVFASIQGELLHE